jgi:hypothetical protein
MKEEIGEKLERLGRVIADEGLAGVLINSQPNFCSRIFSGWKITSEFEPADIRPRLAVLAQLVNIDRNKNG